MKKLQHTLLSLLFSCTSGFAVEPDMELKDFVFPLPVRFAEFAQEDFIGRGREVADIFKMNGISFPLGAKIEMDAANGSLRVRLSRTEALKLVEVINHSIIQSPAKFFRGPFEQPNPAAAEWDLKQQFPVPPSHAAQKGIGIHIENQAGDKITCLIINNSDHPIKFDGSLNSPTYRMQVLSNWKWTEREIVGERCIPGPAYYPQLLPNRACRFDLVLPKTELPSRIGIALLDDVSIQLIQNTIWTDPIKPN
ncbi:MAG: hypothetical protein V4819_09170 [Verrucomicrobiota bacterium]